MSIQNFLNKEGFDDLYQTLIYTLFSLLLFWIGKKIYQKCHASFHVSTELVENDNLAFSIAYTGYLGGLLLSIGGALIGGSNGLFPDIIDLLFYGLLAIVLLNISLWLNDRFVLHKFSNRKEIIEDRNCGAGLVEMASAISSGIIILASISGEGTAPILSLFMKNDVWEGATSAWMGMVSAIACWIIGQIILILVTRFYNKILPFDALEHIEKDNVAVGLSFSGAMISISILLANALWGDLVSVYSYGVDIAIDVAIGFLIIPITRVLADKILLPGQNLTDELIHQETPNIGAALIEAFSYIAIALIIVWAL